MRNLIAMLALTLAAGCATLGDAADALRDNAEFLLCRGITVGAWWRAYGQSQERAQAWLVLCAPYLNQGVE